MFLRNFKQNFLIIFLLVIFFYFFLSIFVIGYDEGTNNTKVAFICSKVMMYFLFSIEFWIETVKIPNILAIILSFATTSFIMSVIFSLLMKLLNKYKK
jgi:hypothetical protein